MVTEPNIVCVIPNLTPCSCASHHKRKEEGKKFPFNEDIPDFTLANYE